MKMTFLPLVNVAKGKVTPKSHDDGSNATISRTQTLPNADKEIVMTKDIVTRLRQWVLDDTIEAADEIERLDKELHQCTIERNTYQRLYNEVLGSVIPKHANPNARGTLIIHNLVANNDVTDDCGWDAVDVVVALDHESWEVVAADVSEFALTNRLIKDNWNVLHEDDIFIYKDKWVRKENE